MALGLFNKIKIYLLCAFLAIITCACSNHDIAEIKAQNSVKDPVTLVVEGVDGEALDNINAYLGSLPKISVKRARVFEREIEDKVKLALRTYGYYHPVVKFKYPDLTELRKKESLQEELKEKIEGFISTKYELLVNIDPGKPLFVRNANINIIGEGAFYKSFKNIIKDSGIKPYSRLNHSSYETLKEALRERALALGFFDAELVISRIMVYGEQNVADIEILYDTGRRYLFGEINYADEKTKELMEPAKNLSNFQSGDKFAAKLIADYSQSLSQTQYYRSVDVRAKVESRHDGVVPVEIALERQRNNLMRAGIGYSTDEDIRLMLGWDKPLLNRYGHSFSFFARGSSVKQDAQAIYKIPRKNPNLDYYYVRLAQIHTDYNDTLSDVSHASFHYVANMTGKWRRDYSLRFEYEDYTQGFDKGYSVNLMPGVLISRQGATGGFDPSEGYKVSLDASFGSAAVTDNTFARFLFSAKGIVSPTLNTRFFYRFTQGVVMGKDSTSIPPSLRFFAGGDQSIRGFSYLSKSAKKQGKLLGARYLSTGTLEYQFPIGISNSRMALFIDAGTACNDYKDANFVYGPGLGYRYMSKYGTARIDFAVGIDNENDDKSFKLHFSFGPEF